MFTSDIEIKINQYRITGNDLTNHVEIQSKLKEDLREDVPINLINVGIKNVRASKGNVSE